MNKRRILAIAMSLCIVAILAVGASLAYFTDTDKATNTFTTGKVDITLVEEFTAQSKLLPGTNKTNNVKKVVTVKNDNDSESSYVRVHIALPSAAVDQDLNAYNDILHWNFKSEDYAAGKWSFQKTFTTESGCQGDGRENQNVYNTTIDGEDYTVWVVTYRTALKAGETTDGAAMTQVYMDWRTETTDGKIYTKANYNADGSKVEGTMIWDTSKGIKIYVVAEGTASDNMGNAYEALNAAFGTPGTADYVAPVF